MRKVFLENLPKKKKGNSETIDWKKSVGMTVKFIYDDIEGDFTICESSKKDSVGLMYLGKYYETYKGSIINCKLSNIIGKRVIGFLYDIGSNIKTEFIDITILDKFTETKDGSTKKYYKFKCNICGWDNGRIRENEIKTRKYCGCCCNSIVVPGINDVATTNPECVKFFQGGIEEAKQYVAGSSARIYPTCPDCKTVKSKSVVVKTMCSTMSIGCPCSDKNSYPQKFVNEFLRQLGVNFVTEKTFEWSSGKRYDFYIPSYEIVIEVHGGQHYKESKFFKDKSFKQQVKNDLFKRDIAQKNGLNYIEIDARKSTLNHIKNSILNSELSVIFNTSNIDWKMCLERASSNLIKVVSDLKKNNPNMTTAQIGNIVGRDVSTISDYLKIGNDLGWCKYSPTDEIKRICAENGRKSRSKPISIYKDGICLGNFLSGKDLERQSVDMFGVKLNGNWAHNACKNNLEYKGYTFKYI